MRRRRAGDRGTADAVGVAEQQPVLELATALRDRVSLPALMRERFDGGAITRLRRQAVTDAYERWEVTYPAGDTTVSGVLLRPRGRGPFPAVVLAHGYIEPSAYVTGQGLAREQDALARAGFVVLHTDYRGHAASDPAGELERETRLGYTRDVLHAVASLKRLPAVDPDRVALLGRSMGGGLVLNALVVQPDAVRSAVVHASVSSSFVENLEEFTVPNRPEAARRLAARSGSRTEDPAFYRGLSSRTTSTASPSPCRSTTARPTTPVPCAGRAAPTGCCAPPARTRASCSTPVSSTPSCRSGRC